MTSLNCWTPAKKCVPNKCVNCYENTFVFDKTQTEGKNGTLYISISNNDDCKVPCPLYTSLYLPKCASICLTKGKIYNFSYVDSNEENPPTKVFYQTGTIIEPKTCIGTTLINPKLTTDERAISKIIATNDDIHKKLQDMCKSYNDLRDILRDI